MHINFWQERWEKNEIAFHMKEVNPMLLKYFPKLSLKKQKRIFIPLCGKTLDIKWLIKQNYKVVGVECNEDAVIDLFNELNVKANISHLANFILYTYKNIEIFVGNFFNLSQKLLEKVDFIYDRAALVALPKNMREKYILHLLNITNKVSQLLITYQYEQNIMKGPPFSVKEKEIKEYYLDSYTIILLEENKNLPSGLKIKSQANEKIWLLKNKSLIIP